MSVSIENIPEIGDLKMVARKDNAFLLQGVTDALLNHIFCGEHLHSQITRSPETVAASGASYGIEKLCGLHLVNADPGGQPAGGGFEHLGAERDGRTPRMARFP